MLYIKEIRQKHKISQKDLALALNIPPNTFNQYENGKREPDYETLKKIADYFNVSMDYLLGRTDKNEKRPSSEEDRRNLLIQFADSDQRKIDLIDYVLSLDSHGLDRIEKLLDAAELLPRE